MTSFLSGTDLDNLGITGWLLVSVRKPVATTILEYSK
jgi:hypothetical protein